jgi:hypothetical protein
VRYDSALTNDWVIAVARRICFRLGKVRREGDGVQPELSSLNMVRLLIEEECPFKDSVAYMPVPRCETCRHWDRNISEGTRVIEEQGRCLMMYEGSKTKIWPEYRDDIMTSADFGCVQWEAK